MSGGCPGRVDEVPGAGPADAAALERLNHQIPSAARPPARITARITRSSAKTQAIPMPRAAHWTHQWPGDVTRLMTNSIARMNGALNRNPTDFNVREPGTICGNLSSGSYGLAVPGVAAEASRFRHSRPDASKTAFASAE